MDIYCVKDRRVTPNVEGTEKIVWTKKQTQNAQSQVRCVWHHQNSFFAGKLTGPSHAEGSGILSNVADTGLELFISKGISFLAKRALRLADIMLLKQ